MYEYEEIKESEAKAYAKSIKAIFKSTSAKNAIGIDDLFTVIAKKYLDPQYVDNSNLNKEEMQMSNNKITLQKKNNYDVIRTKTCNC